MTEIIEGLITIKKTNEIASDQVLNWAVIGRVQKVQKAVPNITKENMFDKIKEAKQS